MRTPNHWKVLSNPLADKYIYQVYRIRDPKQPMHSGNIQTKGPIFEDEAEAARYAHGLNVSMREKEEVCRLLVPALRATQNLSDLLLLEYDDDSETVTAIFENGAKKYVNISMDSGTGMILDIVRRIV